METIIFVCLILVILIISNAKAQKEARKKIRERLKREYDEELIRELKYEEYENLKAYFESVSSEYDNIIDDDTWDDLNMDAVFMQINSTNSSMGREYLYAALRHPRMDREYLEFTDRMSDGFHLNRDLRLKVQEEFAELGYAKQISVYAQLKNILELNNTSNRIHYVMLICLVLSIWIMTRVRPDVGVLLFVAALGTTVVSYYKEKARIESYYTCVKWIVCMIQCSKNIVKMDISFIEKYQEELKNILMNIGKLPKNMFVISSGSNMGGSLAEVFLDYARIITHIDLVKFNNLLFEVKKYQKEIMRMYEILGHIETSIAIAAFRNKQPIWCKPELMAGSDYEAKNLYHMLVDNPVANSIKTDKCVLLTGSNASGKSTFLKAVAINALLSQTIYTSISERYRGDFYLIVSSMSHKDDILNGDSYYMVEIKALKRIIEMAKDSKYKVLCFLDEVLRGTNTVERIAASTQILRSFPKENALCFAATHDIELIKLLDDTFENYHFDESFENNDVKYNYILKKGPAVTRNAIKLLAQTGYDKNLIADAVRMTEVFEVQGVWQV